MNTKIVNLYGGPGTGKSTLAALVFARLKMDGKSVELVTEFAKDLVWEGRSFTLENQLYVLAKQHHRIHRLMGKVEYIVTDSPILLSIIYAKDATRLFEQFILELNSRMDTRNFLLQRADRPYDSAGRNQTLEEAIEIDKDIEALLYQNSIDWCEPRPEFALEDILHYLELSQ